MLERLYEIQQEKQLNSDDLNGQELIINQLARMDLKLE
jgi:hypothetical protein